MLDATDTATYGFAPSGGCGTSGGAGRNTNRTTLSVNATVTATYCYDMADRLSSTIAAGVGAVAYDAHGNTTTISGETHGCDGADHALDATNAVIERTWVLPGGGGILGIGTPGLRLF